MKRKIFFIILFSILLFACTKKKNPTGFYPNLEVKTKTLNWEIFDRYYSFQDSIKNSNSSNLIMGNYNNITSDILLKFKNLPDSIYQIENSKIKMVIKNKFNFDTINSGDINFGLLQTDWKETKATWFTTGDTINWKNGEEFSEEDFTNLTYDNLELLGDTLVFIFNNNIIREWISNDSLNFGIVIYTNKDSSFIVFNSSEFGDDNLEPTLTFDYKITENDTTFLTYSENAYYDTFIYHEISNTEMNYFNNKLFISGIVPISSYIHFDIADSLFLNDESSGVNNDYDLKRITVLRADLILYPKETNYPINELVEIKPYLVISKSAVSENPDIPLEYRTDYISYGKISSDSLYTDEFSIDVTSIIQSIISGTYINAGEESECKNYGIVLKTIKENISLENIEFYGIETQEEDRRPKLIIKYVTPKFDY